MPSSSLNRLAARIFAGSCSVIIASAGAAPATRYEITYYDANANVVGTGRFQLGRGQPTCVVRKAPDDCVNRGIDKKRLNVDGTLRSFRADIGSETWRNDGIEIKWWTDGSQGPGQQFIQRGYNNGTMPRWSFGDVAMGTRMLMMDFDSATENAGTGRWRQLTIDPVNGRTLLQEGLWKATSGNGP